MLERRSWTPSFAVLLLIALAAFAALGPPLAAAFGIDGAGVDLFGRLGPPSAEHPLGTDELGRDLLVRLAEGGRISLLIGIGGALLASLIGTAVGLLAGAGGKRLDGALMRLTDVVIALPLLPLLIVLAALDWGKLGLGWLAGGEAASVWRLVVIVALFGWTTVARLVRASALSLAARPFVTAARALGAKEGRILYRHVLPGVMGPVLVATALTVGQVILAESVLSFLGLGVQPPLASWGSLLTQAQERVYDAPRLAVLPGLMIFLTVLACNLFADDLARRLKL